MASKIITNKSFAIIRNDRNTNSCLLPLPSTLKLPEKVIFLGFFSMKTDKITESDKQFESSY